jgi:hypothetical protein
MSAARKSLIPFLNFFVPSQKLKHKSGTGSKETYGESRNLLRWPLERASLPPTHKDTINAQYAIYSPSELQRNAGKLPCDCASGSPRQTLFRLMRGHSFDNISKLGFSARNRPPSRSGALVIARRQASDCEQFAAIDRQALAASTQTVKIVYHYGILHF